MLFLFWSLDSNVRRLLKAGLFAGLCKNYWKESNKSWLNHAGCRKDWGRFTTECRVLYIYLLDSCAFAPWQSGWGMSQLKRPLCWFLLGSVYQNNFHPVQMGPGGLDRADISCGWTTIWSCCNGFNVPLVFCVCLYFPPLLIKQSSVFLILSTLCWISNVTPLLSININKIKTKHVADKVCQHQLWINLHDLQGILKKWKNQCLVTEHIRAIGGKCSVKFILSNYGFAVSVQRYKPPMQHYT